MHSSSRPCVLHFLPISFSLTWSLYLEKSTSYEVPHYGLFFNLLSFHSFSVQKSPKHPVLKHPVFVIPLLSVTKFRTWCGQNREEGNQKICAFEIT
jgi:hypothetical protein